MAEAVSCQSLAKEPVVHCQVSLTDTWCRRVAPERVFLWVLWFLHLRSFYQSSMSIHSFICHQCCIISANCSMTCLKEQLWELQISQLVESLELCFIASVTILLSTVLHMF